MIFPTTLFLSHCLTLLTLTAVQSALVTPNANPQAVRLYNYLTKIQAQKKVFLSGAYNLDETVYVKSIIGKSPAIRGIDFMRHGSAFIKFEGAPTNNVNTFINSIRADGSILTASWHWATSADLSIQKDKDIFYYKQFNNKAFDFRKFYPKLKADIAIIANQLRALRNAGIPVLWRPLHEADGGWFWWGAYGPEAFKQLWKFMYDELVITHKLNNLIWVWSPSHYYNHGKNAWYPGRSMVDVIAIDYPSTAQYIDCKSTDPTKIIAIGEQSAKDAYNHIKFFKQAPWTYIVSWSDSWGYKVAGAKVVKETVGHPMAVKAPVAY
jgi:mannan endo-1,4-beta-mannosidase